MDKQRRNFIKFGLAGILFPFGSLFGSPLSPGRGLSAVEKLSLLTSSSKVVMVTPGQRLALPSAPKVGSSVFVLVDEVSLKGELPKIVWRDDSILGGREDLVLDQISNFLLVFKGKKSGWVIA